eukprot:9080179-Heterocapsa_arctica.AAC.1
MFCEDALPVANASGDMLKKAVANWLREAKGAPHPRQVRGLDYLIARAAVEAHIPPRSPFAVFLT